MSTDQLRQVFNIYSNIISNSIMGKTGLYSVDDNRRERQYEIRKYLQYCRAKKDVVVESFVIIDDDVELDLYNMTNNAVSTKDEKGLRGLRYYMKKKVIDILNS